MSQLRPLANATKETTASAPAAAHTPASSTRRLDSEFSPSATVAPDDLGPEFTSLRSSPPYLAPSATHAGWLSDSKLAIESAELHLRSANTLATAKLDRHATGHLVLAFEETAKAEVYYLAFLDLVTFDPIQAATKRYFNPAWFYGHPKKQLLGGLSVAASHVGLGSFAAIILGGGAPLAMVGAVSAAGVWVQSQLMEDMKQAAFYSGRPKGYVSEIPPPGPDEYATMRPIVNGYATKWRKLIDGPPDPMDMEKDILSLHAWREVTETGEVKGLTDSFEKLVDALSSVPPLTLDLERGAGSEPPGGADSPPPGP